MTETSLLAEIERVTLEVLTPHPENPRVGDIDAIAESLQENQQYAPLVVQKSTGYVLAGNHRLLAAQQLGWETIDVVYIDVDDEHALRILLADNRTAERGTFDDAQLAAQLAAIRDLKGTGYDESDRAALDQRLAKLREPDPEDDEGVPPPPDEPKSQLGEVYELGPHRLLCGDATDNEQLALLFGDEKAAAVWTDPPYAIYGSSTGVSSSITDDKIVRPFFRAALAAIEEWTPYFAPAFVCCDWRSWPSWWEVAKSTRMEPKNLIVWDKGGSGLGNNFANTYELLGYFIHLPKQKTMTAARKAGIRPILKPNLLRASRPMGDDRLHNAAKPVDLIMEMLEVATDPGAIILDLFAGSGSTLIAADRIGRRCFLVDVEPAWCDVVRTRYAEHSGDMSLVP